MRIRVVLEKSKIKSIVNYSLEYLELAVVDEKAILCCNEESNYSNTFLKIIDTDGEFEHIRVPKSILNNINSELLMDVVVTSSEVKFSFFGKEVRHLYSVTIEKQRGVIDYLSFVSLLGDLPSFTKVDIVNEEYLIAALARLKTAVYCLDGILWGEFQRGYIYLKCSLPNFTLPATSLMNLLSLDSTIRFVSNYVYAEKDGVGVFMFKHRVPVGCDLLDCTNQKFTHDMTLDTSIIKNVMTRFNIENESSIQLDSSKSKLKVKDLHRTIEIDVPTDKIISKVIKDASEDELLDSLDLEESSIDVSSIENPHQVPVISIPKWVLINIMRTPSTRVLISKNFIRLTLGNCKVIYPRGE